MAAEPFSERAEGDTSKHNVKRDRNKKKDEKKKKDEAETKQQAEPSSERAEGDTSKDNVNKGKKKKKKREEKADTKRQEKKLDAVVVENSAAERDEVEGKQSTKSKKSKRKRSDAGEASAGDQVVVTREDKQRKKKDLAVLEKSSQPKNTSKGENGEVKERGKEGNESSPEFSENASAGGEEADVDGKNDKKKHKSKVGKQEGRKENEKVARSKNKGKRVSFADSTEVFRTEGGDSEGIKGGKKKKKKATQTKNKGKRVSFADSAEVFITEGGDSEGIEGGKKKKKKATQTKNKGKRVSFADSAEVSTIEGDDGEEGASSDEPKLVHGQRFTPEEDAILMEAIRDFLEMKQLGEEGIEMIRSARKHKELKHWLVVIGKSLPHRPPLAIYKRAHILLNRSDERKWTQEEKEYIRRFVGKNGTDWKTLSRELGKCSIHVKDTWRRIKSENLKKGSWTQDEHQKLFDLVNLDLRMKAHQKRNLDNRKLRDNIAWEAISDKLTTRNHKGCCLKWYDSLASPMVRKGIWADIDDYLLVEALRFPIRVSTPCYHETASTYFHVLMFLNQKKKKRLQKDDAVCVEDVDWDSLLDHRSGEVCRQRWNQMVRGLGGHREKPFIEQVDVLSRRYCPEMVEYRQPQE